MLVVVVQVGGVRVLVLDALVPVEMAVRLGKFCGNGPELWLAMQQALDLYEAQRALANVIDKIPTRQVPASRPEAERSS